MDATSKLRSGVKGEQRKKKKGAGKEEDGESRNEEGARQEETKGRREARTRIAGNSVGRGHQTFAHHL